ncbi:uncharacterized protein V6R79_015615 [Siganus canaliculatus]
MADPMDYAFPAGDESDDSCYEWDVGQSSKRGSAVQSEDADAVSPRADDNVSLLKRALSKGDVGAVEQLLDNGLDVETRLSFDWTPLMCAVSVAHYDLAKLLLDRGASANFSKDNWTVLMASTTASATENQISRCVELLLSRNADPNVADRSQMTCLMLAARDGYSKVINLLVSHGARVNAQDVNGFTALAVAVQYGREQAVLKLLQLGADKTIRNKTGKGPADLAAAFKHTQITRILASSSHISAVQAFSSTEENLSKFFKTASDNPLSKESVTRLDELELLLHGLGLGHLADVMIEHDVTWSYLMTMEKQELEKIGITNPLDQEKVLSAVQQINLDKVDLDTIQCQLGPDSGSEELLNFLIGVRQQCCYLTESIQDVSGRFPRHASQLVFSLDPKKKARGVCNQLIIQTKDLQKEVTCLHNLLCQMDETGVGCQPPRPGSHGNKRMLPITSFALGALGVSCLWIFYKASSDVFNVQLGRIGYMGTLGSQVMCDNIPGLVSKQRQLCRQHPKVMQAIGAGIKDWISECQHQFRNHRWNCNTTARDQNLFGRLLLRSSREVAFMYAISSAGVVYTLARACSQGELDSCSCDPTKKGSSQDDRGAFNWGGCSDHVEHAMHFSQAFVDAKERKERDARALMNLHNNRAGRKAVKRFMTLECKCHGVSGSCSVRTCWLAMADFRRTGDHLRKRYNGAVQVAVNQYGTGFTAAHAHFKRPSKNDLVYFEDSPDYCVRDHESGSMGTAGRVCNRTSRGVDGCEVMCCGRGYDTSRVSRTTKCECKFHWCCAVHCRDCHQLVDVHTCKGQT